MPAVLTPDRIVAVSGDDQQGTVGHALPQPIVARLVDAAGTPVPNHVVNFVVVSGGGSLAAPATQTNAEGLVQQLWTLGTSTADSQVVEARVLPAGAASPITTRFRASAQAAAAASLQKAAPDSQHAIITRAVAAPPRVRATDQYGNPVRGAVVSFAVTEGGGTVSATTAVTNESGYATLASWRTGAAVGRNQLTAAIGSATVTFTAFGDPALLRLVAQPPSTIRNRTTLAQHPVVELRDETGARLPLGDVTVTAAVNGGGSVTGTTAVSTAPDGTATFSDIAYAGTVGSRTLVFSTFGSSRDSAAVTVTAGPAATLVIAQGNDQPAYTLTTVPVAPAVIVTDADGNPVSGVAVTFAVQQGGGSVGSTIATTNASGVASAGSWTLGGTSGTNTLSASTGGLPSVMFTATAVAVLRAAQLTVGGPPCALTADGRAWCWGYDDIGQPALGTTLSIQVAARLPGELVFTAIDAGDAHVCGVAQGGAAYCWGDNTHGQLGNGTTAPSTTPVPVSGGLTFRSISAGYLTTCGITTQDAAYCWGSDGSNTAKVGKLGHGSTGDRTVPTAVTGELSFSAISTNGEHTCALTTTGSAYCWGDNFYYQLGFESTTWGHSSPQPVAGGLAFTKISLGSQHSCALDAAGIAYCWGRNHIGQRGDASSSPSGVAMPRAVAGGRSYSQIDASANATCALDQQGEIWCWGNPGFYPFGSTPTSLTQWGGAGRYPRGTRAIATGHPSCMIAPSDIVYCWSTRIDAVRIP